MRSGIRAAAGALFVAAVLGLAVLQLRSWNGGVNADGVSYLDLATQYARGDWSAIANGYWSPLYPALVGAALAAGQSPLVYHGDAVPTPELRAVFLVNLIVLALASALYVRLVLRLDEGDATPAPPTVRAFRFAGAGALWIWYTIRLLGATTMTPDLLLACWLLLVVGDLVDTTVRPPSHVRALRVGAALALGFWTKAVFFPLIAVGALAHLALLPRTARRAHARWLLVPVLCLATPLVVVQSAAQGRLSFGETGRLNYGWYVNEARRAIPRVEPVEETRARAPDRAAIVRLDAAPNTVLFAGAASGSFPYWYDPSRFEPAAPYAPSLASQWKTLRANLHWYRVAAGPFVLLCLVAALAALAYQRLSGPRLVALAPALALLGLHALTHAEGRLVGGALVCTLAVALFPGGSPRSAPRPGGWLLRSVQCAALLAVVALSLGRASNRITLARGHPAPAPLRELAALGAGPGANIGLLGSPWGQYWVHQGALRIVVSGEIGSDGGSPDAARLLAIASEACARGTSLAAIVWRGARPAGLPGATELRNGWNAWPAPPGCGT